MTLFLRAARSVIKGTIVLSMAVLAVAATPARACEVTIVRPCACPSNCDSDSCERVCTGIIRTGGGCLYACGGCSCSMIGMDGPKRGLLALLPALSACAASSAEGERSFSNEDGDFVLIPEKSASSEDSAGIGVHLVVVSSGIEIGSVMDGGMAARAGLKSGDELVSIDGRRCSGMKLSEASRSLRGRSGTLVVLLIRSKKTGKVRKYSFNRAPFPSAVSPAVKDLSVKEIPASGFGGTCPKEHGDCRFLYQEKEQCVFTCRRDRNK